MESPEASKLFVNKVLCCRVFPTNVDSPATYRFCNSKSIILALPDTSNKASGVELPIPTRPPPSNLVSAKNNVPPAPTVNILKSNSSWKA